VILDFFVFILDWTGHESLITFNFIGEKILGRDLNIQNVHDDMVKQTLESDMNSQWLSRPIVNMIKVMMMKLHLIMMTVDTFVTVAFPACMRP
jgi:hypothetical protein